MKISVLEASYILAKEFGWTPKQVRDMTNSQLSYYLKMLSANE